jgi:hypothetical protein
MYQKPLDPFVMVRNPVPLQRPRSTAAEELWLDERSVIAQLPALANLFVEGPTSVMEDPRVPQDPRSA